MAQKLRSLVKSKTFGKYIISGLSTFACEYGLYLILFYVVGVSLRVSADASYAVAWVISFLLTRNFVFSHTKQAKNRRQLARQSSLYSVLIAVNFLFNNFAIVWLVNQGVRAYLAKIIIIGVIACWNFLLYKKVIFKEERTHAGEG